MCTVEHDYVVLLWHGVNRTVAAETYFLKCFIQSSREPVARRAPTFFYFWTALSTIKEAGENKPSPSPPGWQIKLIQIM